VLTTPFEIKHGLTIRPAPIISAITSLVSRPTTRSRLGGAGRLAWGDYLRRSFHPGFRLRGLPAGSRPFHRRHLPADAGSPEGSDFTSDIALAEIT